MTDRVAVRDWLTGLQQGLVEAIERADGGARFGGDRWERPGGGGGESRVLKDGALIEQGGVNFSEVAGASLPASATARPARARGRAVHARWASRSCCTRSNPHVPTTHLNLRFFVAEPAQARAGVVVRRRLRPDAVLPGARGRAALAPHGARRLRAASPGGYAQYKAWCDRYFFLPHRNETRGVGGLFFDDLNEPSLRGLLRVRARRRRGFPRRPGCRSRSGAATRRSASASARSSCYGAAATSSSTWSTTAARCSGCRPAGAPSRS